MAVKGVHSVAGFPASCVACLLQGFINAVCDSFGNTYSDHQDGLAQKFGVQAL